PTGSAADFYTSPTPTPTHTPSSPPAGFEGYGPLAANTGSTDRGLFGKARPSSISSLSGIFKPSSSGEKEESSGSMGKLIFKGLKATKEVYSHACTGGKEDGS